MKRLAVATLQPGSSSPATPEKTISLFPVAGRNPKLSRSGQNPT
jgi:hypothetical protein